MISDDPDNRTINKISTIGNVTTVELRNLSTTVSYTVTVLGKNKAGNSIHCTPFVIRHISKDNTDSLSI